MCGARHSSTSCGAKCESVTRDERQDVAVDPWRRPIPPCLRRLADAPGEPAGLAADVAATVALAAPTADGDLAHRQIAAGKSRLDGFAQPAVEHDRALGEPRQLRCEAEVESVPSLRWAARALAVMLRAGS